MTAVNVVVSPKHNCIFIGCDAATYVESTGEIVSLERKAFTVPAWPGAIAGRGDCRMDLLFPILAAKFATFDGLIIGINDELPRLISQCGITETFELILTGFSKERNSPEVWFIYTPGSPTGEGYPPPYTAMRLPNVATFPTPKTETMLAATGASFVLLHEDYDPATIISMIAQMLEMQRRYERDDGVFLIGGCAHLAIIAAAGCIEHRILQKWPEDKVGGRIHPKLINWRKWNRERGLPWKHL